MHSWSGEKEKAAITRLLHARQFRKADNAALSLIQLVQLISLQAVSTTSLRSPGPRHGNADASFRLLSSRLAGRKFAHNLQRMTQPTLALAGADDEECVAEQYGPLFARYNRAEVRLLPGFDHDGVVSSPESFRR